MSPLVAALWAVAVAAAAAEPCRCRPSIQLNGTDGSGQTLLLGAEITPSCPELHLQLSYQAYDRCDTSGNTSWETVPEVRQNSTRRAGDRLWASHTVHLAGCYRVRCCDHYRGPCYTKQVEHIRVDGIHYSTWNVTISAQQVDGTQLSVEVTKQMDPTTNLDFYLPVLMVKLSEMSPVERRVSSCEIHFPEHSLVVFGQEGGLSPGPYRIDVWPRNTVCGTGVCAGRYLLHNITAPEPPSAVRVARDTTTSHTLYIALGVLAGLALVLLSALVCRRFVFRKRLANASEKQPLPVSAVPVVPISVLLLHRGGGGHALDDLRARLRAAGVVLLDARDPTILNLMHTHCSPADLLALKPLRDAKLLFVAGGGDGDGARTASVPAQHYDNMLKFVRNGCLGLDYGRVFTATLGGGSDGDLAGLVEGRLFRLPADIPVLVDHVLSDPRPAAKRLCSAESNADQQPEAV